jgi:hypothetical protein
MEASNIKSEPGNALRHPNIHIHRHILRIAFINAIPVRADRPNPPSLPPNPVSRI